MKKIILTALVAGFPLFSFGVEPPLLQSQVKGLLVITLPDGSHAGTASQMNATAVPTEDAKFSVLFNQEVGPLMKSATQEVEKFMRVRHAAKIPKGYKIEFGFANKHSLKDGPSAATACALMADAIITGEALDPKFAVTGDLTATGEVRPIGGVAAKIRGAVTKDCNLFAVPAGNASALDDLYITDGISAVCKIQIVTVEAFDDVRAIATLKKSEEVEAALAEFEMVRKAVLKNQSNAKHPKVVEKLKAVLKVIPKHYSARLIALHGQGRGPKSLSVGGSLTAINQAADQFAYVLTSRSIASTTGLEDPFSASVSALQKIEKTADPRTKPLLRSYMKLANYCKARRDRKVLANSERVELNNLIANVDRERRKVQTDNEIQEELLGE